MVYVPLNPGPLSIRMKKWLRWTAITFAVSGLAFIGVGIADGIVAAIVLGVVMLAIAWAQQWQTRHAPTL
jgi:MFS superfamily sulfate permease-like transporter